MERAGPAESPKPRDDRRVSFLDLAPRASGEQYAATARSAAGASTLIVGSDAQGLALGSTQRTTQGAHDEPLDDVQAASQLADKPSRERSKLEGSWQGEPRNPARTAEMRSYLEESAEAANLDPEVVRETDCGDSTCRIVLAFKKPEDAAKFNELAQNPELRYELKSLPPSPEALHKLASAQQAKAAPANAAVTPGEKAETPTQAEPPADPAQAPSSPQQLEPPSTMELEVLLALKEESAEPPPAPPQGTP